MEQRFYYRFLRGYTHLCDDFLPKLKKLYPEMEITLRTIDINSTDCINYIITSQELETLSLPKGDLKNELGNILNDGLIATTYEQYNSSIGKNISDFKIDEAVFRNFKSELQLDNSTNLFEPIGVTTSYDEKEKAGKIVSSKIPLEELHTHGGFILDKDGNIGYAEHFHVSDIKFYLDENKDVRFDCRKRLYLDDVSKESLVKEISTNNNSDEKTENEIHEEDYTKLIAAQNESARRLKIASINRTIDSEKNKKRISAILTGVFATGVIVATKYSGVDFEQAIQTEFEAINSLEALKEYLGMITPAMYATIICSVLNFENFLKHKRKQKDAEQELNDMQNYNPTAFLDEVDRQARRK